MSIASRHRKLSSGPVDDEWWTRQEDLLTADVFGAYRYLPFELGLLPFLGRATDIDGRTLADWAGADTWNALIQAEVSFWPAFGSREPDLVITLRSDAGDDLLILIEAKLHAQQHWIEGCSQIGYYGRRLLAGDFDDDVVEGDLPERRTVVYLTKSVAPPMDELRQARSELREAAELGDADVFWVSWHHARAAAGEALAQQERLGAPAHVLALLHDLLDDLSARGFAAPRQRMPWPLELALPLDRGVERWLEHRQPGPVMTTLEAQTLPVIDLPLSQWSVR